MTSRANGLNDDSMDHLEKMSIVMLQGPFFHNDKFDDSLEKLVADINLSMSVCVIT